MSRGVAREVEHRVDDIVHLGDRRFGMVGIIAGPMRRSDSSAIGVRTQPGETRFTRTRGASSTAMDIIIDCTAPFDAA